MTVANPDVSVIIPAHNAAADLPVCLESVQRSEGVTFEIVVVNDASTDDTERIARGRGCRVISVESNIMSASCRNLGAAHARGDILVFFDADQTMAADTLRKYADALTLNQDVDAVVGSLTADTPTSGFLSTFKHFQHHYTHQTANREGATLDSGRLAIRRRVFDALGGFEPAFSHASVEDIALGYRMRREGYRIRFDPTIQVVHLKAYTLMAMVRSDILHRAIPWTALMLRERVFRNDLNTRTGNVWSVVLAWILPAGVVAALLGYPWGWWTVAAAVTAIVILNRAFLAAGGRRIGGAFALRAALFLPAMYFYHGVGLVAGLLAYALGRSSARSRQPPSPTYRVIEPNGS